MGEIETQGAEVPPIVARAVERIALKGLTPMLDTRPSQWRQEAEINLGQGRENAQTRVWHIEVKNGDGTFLGTVVVTERAWTRRFIGARYYSEQKKRTPLRGTDFTFRYNNDALREALGVEKEASV